MFNALLTLSMSQIHLVLSRLCDRVLLHPLEKVIAIGSMKHGTLVMFLPYLIHHLLVLRILLERSKVVSFTAASVILLNLKE
jgi:hypothetical protein